MDIWYIFIYGVYNKVRRMRQKIWTPQHARRFFSSSMLLFKMYYILYPPLNKMYENSHLKKKKKN